MSGVRNRLLFILGLSLLAMYLVAPTGIYFSLPKDQRNDVSLFESKVPDWLPQKHIKLGLDLQGGVQLVLGVDTPQAIRNRLSRIGTEIGRFANTDSKRVTSAFVLKDRNVIQVNLEEGTDVGQFLVDIKDEYPGLAVINRDPVQLEYDSEILKDVESAALNQAERVIRNRVDKWGVAEPSITRRKDGSILVQLPGFKDPSKARELLGRTAQLQFKMVNEESKVLEGILDKLPEGVTYTRDQSHGAISLHAESKKLILDAVGDLIPEGSEILFEVEALAGGEKSRFSSHILFSAAELGGEDILDARVVTDTSSFDNRPAVSLRFSGPGGKRFGDLTGENVGKRMAIVLDNIVVSAPVIQTKIASGEAQITMGSDQRYAEQQQEAQDLALILKSGALPAPITILEERQVGATLGPELADQGLFSVVFGLMLVLLFMVIYYRKPGLLSCVVLVLNGFFLLAGMAMFGFALTLPGFAGLILTLGMGVDANVLINERIRQELREGRNAIKAVENGFNKVFWTIIDANVTTLIAAVVLLETNSSGPIKGFSVALIIGLIVSMFTSLYCSRTLFFWVLGRGTSDKNLRLWLGSAAAEKTKLSTFNFLKGGKAAVAVVAVISLAVFSMGFSKGLNWSVDFAGGTEVEVLFEKPVTADALRKVLTDAKIDSPALQTIGDGEGHWLLRFEGAVEDQTKGIQSIISDGLKDSVPDIQRVDYVGPSIGEELRTQGVMSLGWAILGILLYVGLRFDMRFGPGAVLKMIVDVIIIMGFYVFFQRSFDLTSIAALLTAIGYSVNDTIVIYDRIRENLTLRPRKSLSDNINYSINETLTRTINTSITTILALGGILVLASAQIWNFAAAMALGVLSATLSSTFIASSILVAMEKWRGKGSFSSTGGKPARSTQAG